MLSGRCAVPGFCTRISRISRIFTPCGVFPVRLGENRCLRRKRIRGIREIRVGLLLSESQCKDTTFLIPNSPMLNVAPRYSPIITDKYQGSPKWKKI